jgi:hypothetical protein
MFAGASSTASVSVSCAGATFSWSIAGGTITAGSGTPQVTFTANAAGTLTLSVTVTTAAGCSDFKTADVTVQSAAFGAPPFLRAAGTGSTAVTVSWSPVQSAAQYEVFRSTDNTNWTLRGATASATYSESGLTPSSTYLYKVRAIKADTTASPFSAIDPATTLLFTDEPVSTCTIIRAVHITQLRTAVNAARAAVGLAAFTFTDPALAVGARVKAVHITELRTAVAGVESAIGITPVYTDPTITPGVTIAKAAHVNELRNLVK